MVTAILGGVVAQGEARASATRLAIVEQQLRDCLAGHDPQDGNNHDKRPRTQATSTSVPPAGAHPPPDIAPATTARPRALPPKQPISPPSPDYRRWALQQPELNRTTSHHQGQDTVLQVSAVSSLTTQASPPSANPHGQGQEYQSARDDSTPRMRLRSTTMQYCPWPNPSSRAGQST